MFLVLDNVCPKTLLEDVSTSSMTPIEPLCVESIQPLHSPRKHFSTGLEQQVVVRRHQAVRMARPKKPAGRSR